LARFLDENGKNTVLSEHVDDLRRTADALFAMAETMAELMSSDPVQWASVTYPALLCVGDVTMVWRLLDMARVALKAMDDGGENDFYNGKVMQATYYAGATLPMTRARIDTCLRQGREAVEMPEGAF
jgi:hypothetical protein